jgi:dienelactone hydrolase
VARRQLAQVAVRVREQRGARVALFEQRPDRRDRDAALGAEDRGAPDAHGWGGDADIKAVIEFLSRRADVDQRRIGGVGLSVGGEMMLEAAAEDARLRAVVSEGGSVRSLAEHWDDPDVGAIRKRSRRSSRRRSR